MLDDAGTAVSPPVNATAPPPAWASGPTSTFTPSPNPTAAATPSAPGTFDPYAAPATQPAPPAPATPFSPYEAPAPNAALAPYSPYAPSPYAPTTQPLYPDGMQMPQLFPQGSSTFAQPMRFLQEVRLRDDQLLGLGGSSALAVNDLELSATFAIPFFGSTAPLLITPGFGMHWFGGPATGPPDYADMPPRTYDAYLDAGWHPQITPWLSANLGLRGGAYTDFNTFNTHSIRIMGRGLGIITMTPTVQIAAGIVYLDRNRVKLLPAGGIIWIPDPDHRYEILFPNPKLAKRWTTVGNTDVWLYLSGEYGGGAWTIQRQGGVNDDVDYNDIRVNLGIEGYGLRGQHLFFETGYVFDRKLIYRTATPNFDAASTVMFRGGIEY